MDLTTILIIGGIAAMVILIFGVIVSSREEKSLVEQRLGHILEEDKKLLEQEKKQAPLTDWLNRQTEGAAWGANISKNLARADLKLKVGEYLALIVIAASTVGLLAWFFVDLNVLAAIVGAIAGSFLPGLYVKRLQGKRLQNFADQLADMLNLMVNGLRAGYSTMQAMEAVSKELPAPICDEFRRVVQEMQLGVSMERALDNLLRRVPSPDLDLVITAINVQREVGGNLAEILDTISHTIRERVRIKGEIRVLTSQQVYSGRLLAVLPVLLLGAMYGLNKEYVSYFFEGDPTGFLGYAALAAAAILIVAGYFVMNKIANIEV